MSRGSGLNVIERTKRAQTLGRVLQKALSVLVIAIASLAVFASTAIAGAVNGKLPGDEISVGAAAAYAIQLALMGLAAGSLAFALAQFLGRGAAVAIAGAVMFGGFLLSGYQAAVPALGSSSPAIWLRSTRYEPMRAPKYRVRMSVVEGV